MKIEGALTEVSECLKLSIRWTDFIYDTDADAFTDILAKCDAKPWNFDKGGEKENDVNNPNAVKIAFKTNLSEEELDATRNELFDIFERAHARYELTQRSSVFHITNEVLFPNKITGFVIGKQGQTLWGIKQKTGVDLLLVDDLRGAGANEPPPDGYDRLIIKGSSVKSVREARESVKELLKTANNIIRSNGDITLGNILHQMDDINLQSAKAVNGHPLKRSASDESVLDTKWPATNKHPYVQRGHTDEGRKFSPPKQPSSGGSANAATIVVSDTEARSFGAFRNNPAQIGHQQKSVSSTLKGSLSPTKATPNGTGTIGGFGRSRFQKTDVPAPQVSHQENKNTKYNSQTKMNGIQQKDYDSDETLRDEAYAIINGGDICIPAKKRRNGYGMSPEPSVANKALQDCIVAFMKQSQETTETAAKHFSDSWMANERNLAHQSHRLEDENRQLAAENRQLKTELSKYKEARNTKDSKDSRDRMHAMIEEIADLKSKLDKSEKIRSEKNRHIDMLIIEKDMQRFKDQCLECKMVDKDTVFANCGHFLYCYTCAERFPKCKICRKPTTNKVHIDRDVGNLA